MSTKNITDAQLSEKLIECLFGIDKKSWVRIKHTFNQWSFPEEFYSLIPDWWTTCGDLTRKYTLIKGLFEEIDKEVSHKDFLSFHNVTKGRMTADEFEFWFENIRDTELFPEFHRKREFFRSIKWWEDETFNKLQEALK